MLLTLFFSGMLPAQAAHTRYYVDATNGNDGAAGTSPATAWKSLSKINGTTFGPGDTILLKTGSVWTGSMSPQGSGANGSPNVIDTFGAGAKPVINGNGAVTNTFSLSNQQYWEINNLEVTNDDNFTVENATSSWTGIRITGSGTLNHIHIKNCYFHDVDGDANGKNGSGAIQPVARFNDLLIENNTMRKIDAVGINIRGASGATSTNVVVRGNTIVNAGGDGMIVQGCIKALVEHNLVDGCGTRSVSACSNIWPWNSDSTIFQFNESCNMMGGYDDRPGFDADWKCKGSLFQYNYSYNNGGGFMLICCPGKYNSQYGPDAYNIGTVVRYNISQNDQRNIFDPKGDGSAETKIYNNTIYVGKNIGTPAIISDGSWGGYAGTTYIYNNIFYVLTNNAPFGLNPNYTYDNNCYYLPNTLRPDTTRHKRALFADPLFENPGSGGTGIGTLSGYKIKANSPCIGKGLDLRTLGISPGTRDYFGNPIPAGGAFDIGAHEFPGPPRPTCIITSPIYKARIASGLLIPIIAQASHPANIAIASVAFYQGSTKIGQDASGADGWSFNWGNVADGRYILTARAYDAAGDSAISEPVAITVGYRSPDSPAQTTCGLVSYAYYEGRWSALPNFDTLTPVVKSGTCAGFVLDIRNRADYFGIRYAGYLNVPADGEYTLSVNSNDGSRLLIGQDTIVENDHVGSSQQRSGTIPLRAGKHRITLVYFEAAVPLDLSVYWECAAAGITRQTIPASNLCSSGAVGVVDGEDRLQTAPHAFHIAADAGRISLRFSSAEMATIRIVDHRGKIAMRKQLSPGLHDVVLDARSLPPGRYLCTFIAGKTCQSVAFTIIK
jgi:hypothetical protein